AHAVAGTDIDEAVRINRRWDDCDVSFARRAPEQLAVGSRDADDTRHRHLNILPHAANLGHDERRVLGRVGEFFALPNQRAGLFVERDDGALGSAGREGHVRAIHQGGLGEAPLRTRAAEVFRKVFAPPPLARGGFQAGQLAPLAEGVEHGPSKPPQPGAPDLPSLAVQAGLPSAAFSAMTKLDSFFSPMVKTRSPASETVE